ncbi:MAG: hypothetical protein WKF30_11680 [Pyrinomonadaceae bacterium]
MKKCLFFAAAFFIFSLSSVWAQEKGVDPQNERIRDQSNDRTPGRNGVNQTVGSGRGINFGGGRAESRPVLPNPYRLSARRDNLLLTLEELLRERNMIVDAAASKPEQGLVISEPLTFVKGAVVSQSELGRYANLPPVTTRGWTRGRMNYIVELEPVDSLITNVSINVVIEGRTDGLSGGEWVKLESNGVAEQDLLAALVEKVTGSLPTK